MANISNKTETMPNAPACSNRTVQPRMPRVCPEETGLVCLWSSSNTISLWGTALILSHSIKKLITLLFLPSGERPGANAFTGRQVRGEALFKPAPSSLVTPQGWLWVPCQAQCDPKALPQE